MRKFIPAVLAITSAGALPAWATTDRWSGNSGAIFLGYSAAYQPQFTKTDRLNSGSFSVLEGGVEAADHIKVGLRYSTAPVPSLEIYDPTAFTTTYFPNASLSVMNLLVGFDFPLNEPHQKLGPIQFFLPINAGVTLVSIDAGEANFKAVSFDSALGLGARIYTHSLFRFDVSTLYHFGLPLTPFTGGTTSSPDMKVFSPGGKSMKAGLSGFELRLGVAFLFPDSQESK